MLNMACGGFLYSEDINELLAIYVPAHSVYDCEYWILSPNVISSFIFGTSLTKPHISTDHTM